MITGKVLSVETRNLAEPTTAAATAGATVIYVNDAATFDEFGGVVTIGGAQLNYTAADTEADSITLADGLLADLEEQSLVEYYPPLPIKTALVDIGEDGDPVQATVPHSLLDKFGDGVRIDALAESVTLERRGAYEFVIADAVAEPLTQQSLDYVEGDSGYGLSEAVVQVQDIQATGQLGGTVVSADSIVLAGQDLSTVLDPIPKSTKYALSGEDGLVNKNAGPTNGTTEIRVFTFTPGAVVAGRLYEIGCRGIGIGTVVGDTFWLRFRYTTDGSEPTVSSPIMYGGANLLEVVAANRAQINNAVLYPPVADGLLRIAITLQRRTGTGTLAIIRDLAQTGFQIWRTDLGTDSDSATALQQTAYSDGTGSDNPPVTTKTLSWWATRHDNFPGQASFSGTAPTFNNTAAYQGWWQTSYGSPTSADDRGDFCIFSFDYADIQAKLATAVSVDSCKITFKIRNRLYSTGLDVSILTHTYTGVPSLPGNLVGEIAAGRIILGAGVQPDAAPGSVYTIELGSTIAGMFKTGGRRGVGFYANGTGAAGRGSIFGIPDAARPYLTLTFKSPD